LGKKYSKELGRGEREICFPCSVEKCEKYKGEETSSTSCLSLSNAADLNDPFLSKGKRENSYAVVVSTMTNLLQRIDGHSRMT